MTDLSCVSPSVRVLWKENHIYWSFRDLLHLVDPLCGGAEHSNNARRQIFQRFGRECLSECCWWQRRRHFHEREAVCANDDIYRKSFWYVAALELSVSLCLSCLLIVLGSTRRPGSRTRKRQPADHQTQVGPELGPLLGGFINQNTNWRWSFWVLTIWAGVLWVLVFFTVPETYAPALLREKARKFRLDTGDEKWQAPIERMDRSVAGTVAWSCIRPFQLLVLEPMVLLLCTLSAILLGILYLFFGVWSANPIPCRSRAHCDRLSTLSSRTTTTSHCIRSASAFLAFSSGWPLVW